MSSMLTRKYIGVDLRIAKIVRAIVLFIPVPTLTISAILFFVGKSAQGYLILSAAFVFSGLYFLLRAGYLRATVMTLATVLNIYTTWNCVIGDGIHSIGIMIFPFTILFTAIILRKRDLWFVSILAGVCISVVVLGEVFGFYEARVIQPGNASDVLIIFMLLLVGFVTTSSLSRQIRMGVYHSRQEAKHKGKIERALANNLEQKSELLRQVHHRVKNHLALISSLIDIESMENEQMAAQKVGLQKRVFSVARVHDQLYQTNDYELVDSKGYFEQIIPGFLATTELTQINTDIQIDQNFLEVGSVIKLGLIVNEVLTFLADKSEILLRLDFILFVDSERQLSIVALKRASQSIELDVKTRLAIEHLARSMDGDFDYLEGTEKVIFEINF